MVLYRLFLGNMTFIRYLPSSFVMMRAFVTLINVAMETKLTLHGKKNLLHSLGLVYKSMRGMMTNSIDRDQWLNVTSESRDRI
jgi:hypothetical protein